MVNEVLFLFHIAFMVASVIGAARVGKTGLISLMALQGVIANLFVVKQMSLFGYSVTCTDAYIVGMMLAANLLHERHGRVAAARSTTIMGAVLCWYIAVVFIHQSYLPIPADFADVHFQALLSYTPRIIGASLVAMMAGLKVNEFAFSCAMTTFGRSLGVLCNIGSTIVAHIVDTLLFSFLGLYGVVENLPHVIMVALVVKCGVSILSTPFIACAGCVLPDIPSVLLENE